MLDLNVRPDCWPDCWPGSWPGSWPDCLAWLLYPTVRPDCYSWLLAWLLYWILYLTVWPDYLACLLYLTVIPDCWPDYLAWLLAWVCCSEQARGGWPAAVHQPGCQDCPGMFQVSHTNTCLPIYLREKSWKTKWKKTNFCNFKLVSDYSKWTYSPGLPNTLL